MEENGQSLSLPFAQPPYCFFLCFKEPSSGQNIPWAVFWLGSFSSTSIWFADDALICPRFVRRSFFGVLKDTVVFHFLFFARPTGTSSWSSFSSLNRFRFLSHLSFRDWVPFRLGFVRWVTYFGVVGGSPSVPKFFVSFLDMNRFLFLESSGFFFVYFALLTYFCPWERLWLLSISSRFLSEVEHVPPSCSSFFWLSLRDLEKHIPCYLIKGDSFPDGLWSRHPANDSEEFPPHFVFLLFVFSFFRPLWPFSAS